MEMGIQIDMHTLERAEGRGTNEDEIEDVIRTGFAIPAKYGRIVVEEERAALGEGQVV